MKIEEILLYAVGAILVIGIIWFIWKKKKEGNCPLCKILKKEK